MGDLGGLGGTFRDEKCNGFALLRGSVFGCEVALHQGEDVLFVGGGEAEESLLLPDGLHGHGMDMRLLGGEVYPLRVARIGLVAGTRSWRCPSR